VSNLGVASILHRDTIAIIAGGRTFERGQECFTAGRVLGVEAGTGELCGIVKPKEPGRSPYEVRIWVRDDGLAFQCTCPIGASRQFCKHAVAVALGHFEKERRKGEAELHGLRDRLMGLSLNALLDGLVQQAKQDPSILSALRQLCDGRAE
jgi:uncharacterized Zn finger protein